REAPAALVVVDPVQNTSGELADPDEHALHREGAGRFVERARIHPRAAVDVVEERIPIPLEMVEAVELARTLVDEPVDRDRVYLARSRQVEIAERARVVEQRRREEDARAACRSVSPTEARERVLRVRVALVDRDAVEHAPLACGV